MMATINYDASFEMHFPRCMYGVMLINVPFAIVKLKQKLKIYVDTFADGRWNTYVLLPQLCMHDKDGIYTRCSPYMPITVSGFRSLITFNLQLLLNCFTMEMTPSFSDF